MIRFFGYGFSFFAKVNDKVMGKDQLLIANKLVF